MKKTQLLFAAAALTLVSCGGRSAKQQQQTAMETPIGRKVNEYVEVELKADLSKLPQSERRMLPFLFEAAHTMDNLFWYEAFGDKALMDSLKDEDMRRFAHINYGPWDRLNGNKPFVEGYGSKPAGANFYPADMTKAEFAALKDEGKTSLYTMIRRDSAGKLAVIPYHEFFKKDLEQVANNIKLAALQTKDKELKKYLNLRAEALLNDDYLASDMAWMDMRSNAIDFVVGPIENYEDALYGYKAAHEAFILVKDLEWSKKLEHLNALMPKLQKSLPCEEKYKRETPGKDSDLGVYEVVYYAGDCNAGSKTIAINLPNDERVHVQKGTRKLQLRNAMRAKFDNIMMPIAELLMDEGQLPHVKFDAFFDNVMYHEVSHGLGIKQTVNGRGTVRSALKEAYSGIEEAKADIGGLFLIRQLAKMGEAKGSNMMDSYVTFVAGIFRSVRFGAASAHGKANMLTFSYLQEKGAFVKTPKGKYKVDEQKMRSAVDALLSEILTVQGSGGYDEAVRWMAEKSVIGESLAADLAKIAEAGIPRDVRFRQGPEVLGIK
jgi:hypothetical protein